MSDRFPDCTLHTMEQRSERWHEVRAGKLTATGMGAWLAERPEIRETVKEIKEALASVKLEAGITPLGNKATRSGLLAMLPHGTFKPQHKAGTITAQNTAICQIIGSMSDCNVPDPWEVDVDGPPPRNTQLWAVWNGLRLEPEAEEAFEAATGLSIEKVGFCEHYSKFAGCSPDGLILGENIGFEGKAPLPQTHQKYCMEVRETGTVPDTYRDQVHGSMAVTGADAWWFQSYCPGLPAVRVLVKRDDYTEAMQLGLIEFGDALKAEVKITLAELEEQS